MQRENRRGKESPRNLQPTQGQQEQADGRGVEQDVQQVVAKGEVAPKLVLEAKGAVGGGIVLLCRSQIERDGAEPMRGAQLRPRYVGVVMRGEPAVRRRAVVAAGRAVR